MAFPTPLLFWSDQMDMKDSRSDLFTSIDSFINAIFHARIAGRNKSKFYFTTNQVQNLGDFESFYIAS